MGIDEHKSVDVIESEKHQIIYIGCNLSNLSYTNFTHLKGEFDGSEEKKSTQ